MNRREFTGGLAAAALSASLGTTSAAAIVGNASELSMLEAQQRFLDLRFGMYIHLNMATFEQREWGDPSASSALFNPKSLDTDQWAHAARSAGMAYGCLTTKHHDGFCLWPTATGSACVKDATYKRDIVRAYVDSFRSQGLKTCLYFSILDSARGHPAVLRDAGEDRPGEGATDRATDELWRDYGTSDRRMVRGLEPAEL